MFLTVFAFFFTSNLSYAFYYAGAAILLFIVNDLLIKGYKKQYALLAYLVSTIFCIVSYMLGKNTELILLYLIFTAVVLANYIVRRCISKKASQAG